MTESEKKLEKKIEAWKQRLLDLGMRNKLLNYKSTKSSTLDFSKPSLEELWDRVVVERGSLSFPFDDEDEQKQKMDGTERVRVGNTEEIITIPSSAQRKRTLRNLRAKAKIFIEEQGINALYLSFGFLRWKEAKQSKEFHDAPIILVPVELTNEAINKPFQLAYNGDEILVNPTLIYKLKSEFSIDLPEFNEEDKLDSYFADVEQRIPLHDEWCVKKEVSLGLLSFTKMSMYQDLEQHKDAILMNAIIQAIAGNAKALSDASTYDISQCDLDKEISPKETFHVVDADSSQQEAILCANKGVSFILQGPPGTGKSQTITNIIAELLAKKKKVLFVSEKMAALDVVHRRLTECGLNNFCLVLHSNKAKRREVLNQFDNVLHLARRSKGDSDRMLQHFAQLSEDRKKLNAYVSQLHSVVKPLQKSIYEVHGLLAALDGCADASFTMNNVKDITEEQYRHFITKLRALSSTIRTDEMQNVWKDAKCLNLTRAFMQELNVQLTNLVDASSHLNDCIARVKRKLISEGVVSGVLQCVEQKLREAPFDVWDKLTSPSELDQVKQVKAEIEERQNTYKNLYELIARDFEKEIFSLPLTEELYFRFKQSCESLWLKRLFNRQHQRDRNAIRQYLKNAKAAYTDGNLLNVLKKLREMNEITEAFQEQEPCYSALLGSMYRHLKTDTQQIADTINTFHTLADLRTNLRWLLTHCAETQAQTLSWTERLCKCLVDCLSHSEKAGLKDRWSEASQLISELEAKREALTEPYRWYMSLFATTENFALLTIAELTAHVEAAKNGLPKLHSLQDYIRLKQECCQLGLGSFIKVVEEKSIAGADVENVFKKAFLNMWLDAVESDYPEVCHFRRNSQEERIESFRRLDNKLFLLNRQRILHELMNSIPSTDRVSKSEELGILLNEIAKKRKLKSIRKLFKETPHVVMTLKPCMMMSPLSVSLFLESDSFKFDTVIFDEASQVRSEDAIGAILRGQQVIIAGDSKQLPPTNFFSSTVSDEEYDHKDEEEIDVDAYDSVLEEANMLPSCTLRWHYRSKHEHLIAFSNRMIYKNRLITFPSSLEEGSDRGVEFIHVKDGFYDRGGNSGNRIEAERVAALIMEHFRKHPMRSLGVITFGEKQLDAIETCLRKLRMQDSSLEHFFNENEKEPFFIKSLENVQGDERDTIILSVGYGKNSHGVMSHNFGPLNNDGGERRLNVAITRAKFNLKVVASITAYDIDVDKVSHDGPRLLRDYIAFAQNAQEFLSAHTTEDSDAECESPFEESVYNFLVDKGYAVSKQVGCSGYRIDLAVKHPEKPGRYVLGIECDGASYHSAQTARERDRLRQSVLESMGWKIYRIWSTDWIRNPQTEKENLVHAIKQHIEQYEEETPSSKPADEMLSDEQDFFPEVDNSPSTQNNRYLFDEYEHAIVSHLNFSEYNDSSIAQCAMEIIQKEYPIHIDCICQLLVQLSSREKATPKFKQTVKEAMNRCKSAYTVDEKGFYYPSNVDIDDLLQIPCRLKSNRDSKYISSKEFARGMMIIAKDSMGISEKDLCKKTTYAFGFGSMKSALFQELQDALDILKNKGIVRIEEDRIYFESDQNFPQA